MKLNIKVTGRGLGGRYQPYGFKADTSETRAPWEPSRGGVGIREASSPAGASPNPRLRKLDLGLFPPPAPHPPLRWQKFPGGRFALGTKRAFLPRRAQPIRRAPRLQAGPGGRAPRTAWRGHPRLTQEGLQEDFSPQRAHGRGVERRFLGKKQRSVHTLRPRQQPCLREPESGSPVPRRVGHRPPACVPSSGVGGAAARPPPSGLAQPACPRRRPCALFRRHRGRPASMRSLRYAASARARRLRQSDCTLQGLRVPAQGPGDLGTPSSGKN